MGFHLATFNRPQGRYWKLWAAVTAVVLVMAVMVASAPPAGAADPTVPDAPSGLSGWWRSGEVTLSWTAPASGSPLTGYEYRYWAVSESAPDDWTVLPADVRTVKVTDLTDDVAYTFEVRAKNASGSGQSDTIDAMPLSLREGDIRLIEGSQSGGIIQVFLSDRWGRVCDDGFVDENVQVACRQLGYDDGVNVELDSEDERLTGAEGYPWTFAMDDVFCRGCEDRLVDCPYRGNWKYNCFMVEAVFVECDPDSLGPPRNLQLIPGEQAGRLAWNAPRSDGGSPILRYEYRYRIANGEYSGWVDAGRHLTTTVPGRSGAASMRIELRAVNAEGVSATTGVGALPIKSFTLIDADRGVALRSLRDGDHVPYHEVDGKNLSIRANVPKSQDVGSVALSLSGAMTHSSTELDNPHSLFGDTPYTRNDQTSDDSTRRKDGNYTGQQFNAGTYAISASAYTSKDPVGEAADSLTVEFGIGHVPPSAPRNLKAHGDASGVALSWEPPQNKGGAPITKYQRRSKAAGDSAEWTVWSDIDNGGQLTVTLTEAAGMHELRAVNAVDGVELTGAAVSLTVPAVPDAPRDLSLVTESGQLTLTWGAPALNGGASISGYRYRLAADGAELDAWSESQTSTTATITVTEGATDYLVEVRALNTAGEGAVATASTVSISSVTLVGPEGHGDLLTLFDGALVLLSDYDADQFSVRAHPFRGAPVARVLFELSGAMEHAVVDRQRPFTLYGELAGGHANTRQLEIGLYRLVVTAYAEPPQSSRALQTLELNFAVFEELPHMPSGLAANWADDKLRLSWSKPANSGQSVITGYEYRSTPTGQPFGDDWTSVGDDLEFELANVADGAAYDFEVRAVTAMGLPGQAAELTVPNVPSAPRELEASREEGALALRWQAPANNGGASVSGYQYRYGRLGQGLGGWRDAPLSQSAGIADDVGYAVEVRAVNAAGEGEIAVAETKVIWKVMVIQTYLPEYQELVEIKNGDRHSRWRYPDQRESLRVVPYPQANVGSMSMDLRKGWHIGTDEPYGWGEEIYREKTGPPYNVYEWWHDVVLSIGNYRLDVVAYEGPDQTGEVLETLTLNFSVSWDTPRPDAPTNLAVSCNDAGQTVLSWEDDNFWWLIVQFGTYEYRYQAGLEGVSPETGWINTLDELSAELDIPCDQAYSFEVRATGSGGKSDPVPYVRVAAPGPVEELMTMGQGKGLSVAWQPPVEHSSSPPVSGYQYRYAAAGLEGGEFGELQEDRTAEITGFDRSKPVMIEVRAVNELGDGAVATAQANSIGELTLVGVAGDGPSDLLTLTEGRTVRLADHSAQLFTIRANSLQGGKPVGSVSFDLRGARNHTHTDNAWPYTLYGGVYASQPAVRTLPAGNYLLTVAAYSADDLGGEHLGSLTVSFRVVGDGPASPAAGSCADGVCPAAPLIIGVARVGELLAVDTSGISGDDGGEEPAFTYQWLGNDGDGEAEIEGARLAAYQLTPGDQGRTITVRVSYSDSAGNERSLTSAATAVVAPPPDQLAPVPVWSADMSVVDYGNGTIGAPTADLFSNVGGSSGLLAKWLWYYQPERKLRLALSDVLPGVDEMTLQVGNLALLFPPGTSAGSGFTWSDVDVDWEQGETLAVRIVRTASLDLSGDQQPNEASINSSPTGRPTVGGEARVGQTLTADVSGIDDADELAYAVFAYQWVRSDGSVDADIAGATGDTYTLVEADEGQTIEVKVSFIDDQGNPETLTSDPTGAVTPAAGPLAGFSLAADGTGGELVELVEGVQVVTGEYSATLFAIRANLAAGETVGSVRFELHRDGVSVITGGGKTESYAPYSLYGDEGGQNLTGAPLPAGDYRLTATAHSEKGAGGDQLGRLEVSFTVVETAPTPADTPVQEQQEPAPAQNSRATGLLTIGGEARVGQTLTADTSGISDDDQMDNAVFSYQWLRGNAEIVGANGSSYTLVEADVGRTVKVKVSFTDGADNSETLTSDPTGAVAPDPGPLTTFTVVDASSDPDTVLGTPVDGGTLTLAGPAGDSYGIRVNTDSNHDGHDDIHKVVLALSGGKTEGKTEWEAPYSLYGDDGQDNLGGGDLPAGGYKLKATAYRANGDVLGTLQVSFEVAYAALAGEATPAQNTLATGAPTIDGTAQVGQTLAADTSGIDDDDGLTNVAFSYQWTRSDGGLDTNITSATGATYTLVAADEDKTIKVTVSFTDTEGNPETLTSDPTGEVEAKPNTLATGAPTITGIARVGETLTADVSGTARR